MIISQKKKKQFSLFPSPVHYLFHVQGYEHRLFSIKIERHITHREGANTRALRNIRLKYLNAIVPILTIRNEHDDARHKNISESKTPATAAACERMLWIAGFWRLVQCGNRIYFINKISCTRKKTINKLHTHTYFQ